MKIQVVIEAESIHEYTEAIKALAAGYQVNAVAPVEVVVPVNIDTIKVAEEKPKRNRTRAAADKLSKAEEKEIVEDAKKQQKQAEELEKQADKAIEESEEKASFSNTVTEPTHGFPAVKLIASKLSKIQDGKAEVKFLLDKFGAKKLSDLQEENYDEFHELASKAIADHDNAPAKEDKPSEDVSDGDDVVQEEDGGAEDKPVTIEMIRAKAKELSVAGYKEEIKAVLKELGAPSLTKIPKEKYDAFYNALGNI